MNCEAFADDSTTKHLDQISMVTSNFGMLVFADILQDWFQFLGGKPGEVVVVDCRQRSQTQRVYRQLFEEGRLTNCR
jgi:hypothetical protein